MRAILLALVLMTPATAMSAEPLTDTLREGCLKILRVGLASDEFWPAMHAAEALTLAGETRAVLAALAKRSETDDQKRCGLAREAVRAGDRTKLPILFEILDKPGSNGHTHAAESLYKVLELADGKKMRAAFAQDADLRLKLMAAAALARCGHPTALDAARKYLTHEDVEIRKIAAWLLGQLGKPSDAKAIRAGLPNETDPLAIAYFVHALALLGDAEGKAALVKNLSSDNAAVKTYAAEFAGYCRATEARAALEKLLQDPVLDVRVRAAQSLLVLSLPAEKLGLPAASVKPENFSRDVYAASEKHPRYSEGSVAILKDGTLLFATTEFVGGAADAATARIIARESHDGGRSWGESRVLQENTGKQNVMSATLRRLKPLPDAPLGLFYLVKNGPNDLKVYVRVSQDEARTFGEPICVTDQPGYHVINNDRVTLLASGRIICPVAWAEDLAKSNGGHFVCVCFFSDDGGKSWKKGADTVDAPKRGAMEPEVVEISDGKLMMIARTQAGQIATAISKDGGDHWSNSEPLPVKAPEAPATIRRIPATGDLLLVWNNTHEPKAGHGGKRTPLAAAVSSDDGRTWKHILNLETSPDHGFAYTSLLFVKDRVLLTYYVADAKTGRISSRFRSLPVSQLYEQP